MAIWATILIAVLGGSLAGGLATVIAAWMNARHDTRVRLHGIIAAAYAEAVAGIEEVYHVVSTVYLDLRRTIDADPRSRFLSA